MRKISWAGAPDSREAKDRLRENLIDIKAICLSLNLFTTSWINSAGETRALNNVTKTFGN